MADKKCYALVGTGSRAAMYIEALATRYRNVADLVAFCDLSLTRMDWYNQWLHTFAGLPPCATYHADQFRQMLQETKPDIVIVTTVDSSHHTYIIMAMEAGCDVITEKPMTTDLEKLRLIYEAIAQTGQNLRVAFNYRYAPAYSAVKQLMVAETIGHPLVVDFSWMLDTQHGADYFRRWHRERQNSGGLLVHKAAHHFDLVNWWIDSVPESVSAMGALLFYGQENATARGEYYAYERYTGIQEALSDPFALFLDQNAVFRELYLAAEAETGYIRDRNVFGSPITIEDSMCVTAHYRNRAMLSYCLTAFSPWEGMRVAITGTKGRIELEVVESTHHLLSSAETAKASKEHFQSAKLWVYPIFGTPYQVNIPDAEGGHGGADPLMLEQIFSPDPVQDSLNRVASHHDGAASLLLGFAANESIRTQKFIAINDLISWPNHL